MKPISEQGYLILAIDQPEISYSNCARQLALSLKHWHPAAKICLVTNCQHTVDQQLFDFQHQLAEPVDHSNAWANDWQIFNLTPFRETLKLEADMLVTSPIDHWWDMLRHRDIVVSTGCKNWKQEISDSRAYRKIFDANHLPDVYNAITYWRRSETAKQFFDTVKDIFANWQQYRTLLKFPEERPSTDVVYAMAAVIVGPDKCTMPFASYPKIIHMKKHIAKTKTEHWLDELVFEPLDHAVKINTLSQWGCLHHGVKTLKVYD